jgi:hypothetical protein
VTSGEKPDEEAGEHCLLTDQDLPDLVRELATQGRLIRDAILQDIGQTVSSS